MHTINLPARNHNCCVTGLGTATRVLKAHFSLDSSFSFFFSSVGGQQGNVQDQFDHEGIGLTYLTPLRFRWGRKRCLTDCTQFLMVINSGLRVRESNKHFFIRHLVFLPGSGEEKKSLRFVYSFHIIVCYCCDGDSCCRHGCHGCCYRWHVCGIAPEQREVGGAIGWQIALVQNNMTSYYTCR